MSAPADAVAIGLALALLAGAALLLRLQGAELARVVRRLLVVVPHLPYPPANPGSVYGCPCATATAR
jgi:hypothetical protein